MAKMYKNRTPAEMMSATPGAKFKKALEPKKKKKKEKKEGFYEKFDKNR